MHTQPTESSGQQQMLWCKCYILNKTCIIKFSSKQQAAPYTQGRAKPYNNDKKTQPYTPRWVVLEGKGKQLLIYPECLCLVVPHSPKAPASSGCCRELRLKVKPKRGSSLWPLDMYDRLATSTSHLQRLRRISQH
jgi:hypothetical protein